MTHTPVEVPDSLFTQLKAKFSEPQLVELTAAIAWENYRARFDHAFGIESQGFSQGAYCALPERPQGTAGSVCKLAATPLWLPFDFAHGPELVEGRKGSAFPDDEEKNILKSKGLPPAGKP